VSFLFSSISVADAKPKQFVKFVRRVPRAFSTTDIYVYFLARTCVSAFVMWNPEICLCTSNKFSFLYGRDMARKLGTNFLRIDSYMKVFISHEDWQFKATYITHVVIFYIWVWSQSFFWRCESPVKSSSKVKSRNKILKSEMWRWFISKYLIFVTIDPPAKQVCHNEEN